MTRKPTDILTSIVKHALVKTVTDIGQLSHAEHLQLDRAVRYGILSKGKGGAFPCVKTVYAHPAFDFAGDRVKWMDYWRKVSKIDAARLGAAYELQERGMMV